MKVVVYGKKWGSFKDKDTGNMVNYGKLYCLSDFPASESGEYEGQQALIVSLSPQSLRDVPIPCRADLSFNNYGRLDSVEVIEVLHG